MIEVRIPGMCWARLCRESEFNLFRERFAVLPRGTGISYRGQLELDQVETVSALASGYADMDPQHATIRFTASERSAFLLLAARTRAAIASATGLHRVSKK